jgi:hypothetical protein
LNIFVLDEDPVKAAEYHCNKHVVKMILECTQMLSTVHWHYLEQELKSKNGPEIFNERDKFLYIKENSDEDKHPPYKMTHIHHPCTVWTSLTYSNYMWHIELAQALLCEYTKRYKKIHKLATGIKWLADHPPIGIPVMYRTPFAVTIKDESLKVLNTKTRVRLGSDRTTKPDTWELVRDTGLKAGCITDECGNKLDFDQKPNFRKLKEMTDRNSLYYTYYDVVASYRKYYIKEKVGFAKWEPHTRIPEWFLEGLNEK